MFVFNFCSIFFELSEDYWNTQFYSTFFLQKRRVQVQQIVHINPQGTKKATICPYKPTWSQEQKLFHRNHYAIRQSIERLNKPMEHFYFLKKESIFSILKSWVWNVRLPHKIVKFRVCIKNPINCSFLIRYTAFMF